ncbi:MAG: helix-turn-helix transcriptional regulator [Ruminococcaceae bacterium]|nr:helix-turn-helix transcriptional regulator [Oscillospiraceae bacterium]
MNADFSRTLALLRQEKGISQRQAAKDLGISQALMSHYENGVREPGLAFVRKVCDYYHVSADYLLGRTLDRDGAVIDAQELYDASNEKGTLRGSVTATLQKKLLVNTTSLLFELLGRTGSREAVNAAGGYLGGALYQLYRMLHRAAGGKDKFFGLGGTAFSMDAVDADMRLARVSFAQALDALEENEAALPAVDSAALSEAYPSLTQSLTQVLHMTEEDTNRLLGR